MLKHLHIKHFTIIDELNLDLTDGLTVLTGETGAGKSILIDALELALGARANTMLIQKDQKRCEITATIDTTHITSAQKWLRDEELDEGEECLISRVISRDGRSRNTINGRPCTLEQVRSLGALLVHIHGQNQHTLLTQSDYQRKLLDTFAGHRELCQNVRNHFQRWRQANDELSTLMGTDEDQAQKKEWLSFQIEELSELSLAEGELANLEAQYKKLSNATQFILSCEDILNTLSGEGHNLMREVDRIIQSLKQLPTEKETTEAIQLLQQTSIHMEEAQHNVNRYLSNLTTDPQALDQIERRLARIYELARKHKVLPEELHQKQTRLEKELEALTGMDERIAQLQTEITTAQTNYQAAAEKLTLSRQAAANRLNQAVTAHIKTLGMQHGELHVTLQPLEDQMPHTYGNERIAFLIVTNPGHTPHSLAKVASGGELSRISLAIQVVAAEAFHSPTLIFDEVDVGIGGKTADIVGQQLRKLGEKAQVLCVTHLPQVAANGHQHLHIAKQVNNNKVTTSITILSAEERTQEIARMLGGVNITEKTRAHAEEMLAR
ncbi:MAG: repair protein RecN [Gammaproteobacteria bacterium]|jgi:DNA repair protein RecN (Recombination protein N)|nr:repair protein RecN [Gammaproteobacteria bacterium]